MSRQYPVRAVEERGKEGERERDSRRCDAAAAAMPSQHNRRDADATFAKAFFAMQHNTRLALFCSVNQARSARARPRPLARLVGKTGDRTKERICPIERGEGNEAS